MKAIRYIFLACALSAISIALPAHAAGNESDAVLKADRARLDAMLANDANALAKTLTDDCLYVHSYGASQTKEEFISAFRKGALAYKKLDYREKPQVRFYGNDAAVLTGRMDLEVVNEEGRRLKPVLLLTAVYVRDDGQWKLASYQSTTSASP